MSGNGFSGNGFSGNGFSTQDVCIEFRCEYGDCDYCLKKYSLDGSFEKRKIEAMKRDTERLRENYIKATQNGNRKPFCNNWLCVGHDCGLCATK
jgi:hypothetical protein